MSRWKGWVGAVLVGGIVVAGCAPSSREETRAPLPTDAGGSTEAVRSSLDGMPVSFVANAGRWDSRASWVASGRDVTAYFVDAGVRWALPGWALDQTLVGARPARPTASSTGPGTVSYLGDTVAAALPTATELRLDQAWPGVDVTWSGAGGHVEATYHLAAGADPAQVRVAWQGADSLTVTADGHLAVATPVRTFEEDAPKAFQQVDGRRVPVDVAYELHNEDSYGFRVGAYDPTRPLVIDPAVLLYAGFLGGSGADFGYDIAVDGAGNAYVAGWTLSTAATFPETTGAVQAANAGDVDAFVAKINPSGSSLLYATFLGGSNGDEAHGIAVDTAGNAYVTGITTSGNFPTANPIQGDAGGTDAFVAKLNPAGSALIYATYLGGSGVDVGYGIAVDSVGNAYVTGGTTSGDFPTANALQSGPAGPDAFVAKLNPAGSALVYATYLGGGSAESANAVAVDTTGNAYVTGFTTSANFPTANPIQAAPGGDSDAFLAKLNPAGSALVYSTYVGGNAFDIGSDVAVDGAGNAFMTGSTVSANFPTANALAASHAGFRDAFAVKVNPAGSALVYSTYLGGSNSDEGFGIAVDGAGNAYVTGPTLSEDFPTANAFHTDNPGGDAYVTKLNPAGSALAYSTFLGGGALAFGIASDGAGNAYVTGVTTSAGATFPETPGVFQPVAGGGQDAFVAKLADVKPTPTITTQASAGGMVGTPVRDVATLAGGSSPTGTVSFRLYSDANCNTEVFTSTNALAGATATSGSFTPAAAATYYWTAVYNGDANNNSATSACRAPNESVTITAFQAPASTRTITGDLLGPVTVNAGESVLITAARVVGPVTVNTGGALTVVNSQIARGVVATAPSFFSICGTAVSGPAPATALSVTGAKVPIRVGDPATGCAGNQFAGQVVLSGNLAVTFGANIAFNNATLDNNGPGNTVIKADTVSGILACAGNNPPPTNAGQPNTAGAKTGQCAGL